MMRNRAHDPSTYDFKAGEQILVDANVWLYLQPPAAQPPPPFARSYSNALKNVLSAKALPVVEALILSEYVNRYLRLEYSATWQSKYPSFKKFRLSKEFSKVAQSVVAEVKQILAIAAAKDTWLEAVSISDILAEIVSGTLDFNDGVLVETCRLRGWKLLTNDVDMRIGGIDVLTTNPKLLAACP